MSTDGPPGDAAPAPAERTAPAERAERTERAERVELPPIPKPSLLLYKIVRNLIVGFAKVFWRLRIHGQEHLPPTGAYVLAPIHRSNIDSLLLSSITSRRLRAMGKHTLFKTKVGAWFIGSLGAFPVVRGTADRDALRRCIEVLDDGEPLIIFPEGTRQVGPEVQPLYEGAAYVAAKANVPIVPIGLGGTEAAMPKGSKTLKKSRIHIVIGAPLPPPTATSGGRASRKEIHATTEQLKVELQRLFDDAQKRAGQPVGLAP